MTASENTSPKKGTWLWIAAGLLIGLGVGLAVLLGFRGGGAIYNRLTGSVQSPAVPAVNALAPGFTLQTVDGKPVSLSDLRGKNVLINFWATWCGPCRLEMPLLQAAQDNFAGRLVVVAVNNDEPPDKVQAFIDELGLHLTVLLDPGTKIAELYRVRGYPTSLFLDPQGIIRYQHIGVLNKSTLDGYLTDLGLKE